MRSEAESRQEGRKESNYGNLQDRAEAAAGSYSLH